MIRSFKDKRTEALYQGETVAAFQSIKAVALRMLDAATQLADLRSPPGNRLEALAGNRRGQHSIRINDQWRICFERPTASPGPANVEIVDYH